MAPTLPFNFRLAGSNPMVIADDTKLEFLLDPYTRQDAAAFAVRHACNVFFRVGEVSDQLGGGVALATAVAGYRGAAIEAVRLTPTGGVRVPGVFQAAVYSNLVPSHEGASATVPPSGRALNVAFETLSNLITASIAEAASRPGTLLAADAAGSSNYVAGSNGASNALPNGVVAGPIVCSDLQVVDGGRVVAGYYAGLPTDYLAGGAALPASAAALRSAYVDLSNWFVEAMPTWWRAGAGAGAAAGGAAGASALGPPFAVGAALLSADGQPRMRFAENGEAAYAAYAPSNAARLFAWTDSRTNGVAAALTGGGDLAVAGALVLPDGSRLEAVTSAPASVAGTAAASNAAASAAALAALEARVAALEARLPA